MDVSRGKHETEILDGIDDAPDLREQVRQFVNRVRQGAGDDGLRQVVRDLQKESGMGGVFDGEADRGSVSEARGLRWFFAEIWAYPQFRMLACSLVIAAWLAASSEKLGAGNIAFAVFGAFLFCKWGEAVYRLLGPGQLVLKCMAAIFGLVLVVAFVANEARPGAGLAAALAALTVTALLVMSKATERLAQSRMPLVRFVRRWF